VKRLRAGLLLGGFVALTVPLMPVQQLFKWIWPRMARRFPHFYHKQLARLLGFRITIEGKPPRHGPMLLVANHVSWIDIVAFSAALPVSFVAKREVGKWPMFGQLARLQRTVFVDRERRHATGAAHHEMTDRLKRGDTLMLFPEGTSHDGINVLPFKSAFFGSAELEGVPIVPVAIAYTRIHGLPMTRRQRPQFAWYGDMDLPPHLWEVLQAGPIGITIKFHEPLDIVKTGGRKQLARASESQIRDSLARLLHGR
jgi:1-acyl-sn-glycerol-3-phosphate acyltransferase